jgi:hypothetical protein
VTTLRFPAGASLVEVVIALGLLASALISAAGLLAVGNRQVHGGGLRSQALAVAEAIVEELDVGGYARPIARLGCDPTQPSCSVVSGDPALSVWQVLAQIDLPAPIIEVRIEAVGAATLDTAPALRLSVRVFWREGLRSRRIHLIGLRI